MQIPDKLTYNGEDYYNFTSYSPVFSKTGGEYLYHAWVISFVSDHKILLMNRDKDLDVVVSLTNKQLKELCKDCERET